MSRTLAAILSTLVLGAGAGLPAAAHYAKAPAHAAGSAVPSGGPALHRTVTVDPQGAARTIEVVRGARVEITIHGAGPGALHLHGYDVEVAAEAGKPAILTFDATHNGRFPVAMHVTDDLLGDIDRPVLYIEVRAP